MRADEPETLPRRAAALASDPLNGESFGMKHANNGLMKNSTSAIHYYPGAQQRVSKVTAFIVCTGAVALAVVLIAVFR
jgi:hypothetical protein